MNGNRDSAYHNLFVMASYFTDAAWEAYMRIRSVGFWKQEERKRNSINQDACEEKGKYRLNIEFSPPFLTCVHLSAASSSEESDISCDLYSMALCFKKTG